MINLKTPVRELMSKELITVSKDTPLTTVKDIFKKHRFHHIPVVEFNTLLGLISKTDFLNFKGATKTIESRCEAFRLRKHTAKDIMTTGLAKLEENDRIEVAITVFEENLFHAIPIEQEGKLVGILTTYDLIINLAESVEEHSKQRNKAIAAIA